MDTSRILPDIGTPVSSPAFDESFVDDMSPGELLYAATFFTRKAAQRMADPATAHQIATFQTETGDDWSGHTIPVDELPDDEQAEPRERPLPVPPDNYYDTLPGMAWMLRQQHQANDALVTHFARQLEPALDDQSRYLGAPVGVRAYKDGRTYYREVLKFSRVTSKRVHDRLPYVTWTPGADPDLASSQPKFPTLAERYAAGTIPAENIDRVLSLDQDMTAYVQKTGASADYKNDVMQAFEPTLAEAAEHATPDELSQAKTRWAATMAHAIDPDGPPIDIIKSKPADNAIRTRNHADGSGTISMHATAPIYAIFKNFALHQLNFNGTPVQLPDGLAEFLTPDQDETHETAQQPEHDSSTDHQGDSASNQAGVDADEQSESPPDPAATFDDINDLPSGPDPTADGAIDSDGNTVTNDQLNQLHGLTTGQRLGAIVIGMFMNLLTMDPKEIGIKKAHGAAAQLMIVQDAETAYHMLGAGALPEAVRRPSGPAGIIPPVIARPNPTDPNTPLCLNPEHTLGYSPPSWTSFISEAVNNGPLHPDHAETLACDSVLVGQIWNHHHSVLDQRRKYRLFTPDQRRAILARDRGCQAPGCTLPAIYSQIHHIKEWQQGGDTNIDNAITLCAACHAAVHNGKWNIVRHHGITFFQPAPWLDPYQPLLRNLYWAI